MDWVDQKKKFCTWSILYTINWYVRRQLLYSTEYYVKFTSGISWINVLQENKMANFIDYGCFIPEAKSIFNLSKCPATLRMA